MAIILFASTVSLNAITRLRVGSILLFLTWCEWEGEGEGEGVGCAAYSGEKPGSRVLGDLFLVAVLLLILGAHRRVPSHRG